MSRETIIANKIAILATGDEVSQGEIINSNSQEIAQRLLNANMQVRMHIVSPDNITEIENAITFLLAHHRALIMTGGLGPTSDDLTRYALSNALQQPLLFDETSWDAICQRLQRFGYATPPENNRQQALFPEGATIIPNPNGTAAGCMIQKNDQFIFMLPGPPAECLPLIDTVILPTLTQAHFPQVLYREKWLLFGVSEGKIAQELDQLTQAYDCITGYRLCYPYLECKIQSANKDDFAVASALVAEAVKPYLLGNGKQIASALLQEKFIELQNKVTICDFATGGLLEATLKTPSTLSHLSFSHDKTMLSPEMLTIEIHGLIEFWEQKNVGGSTHLEILFVRDDTETKIQINIPFRDNRVKLYAVEFICGRIYQFL
jgi:nicotinamide-nucleotide amidase